MLRRIVTSYWTAVTLGALAVLLHVSWYTVDKAPGGEVLSGFGAALMVLGIFVGSRPYIRAGLAKLVSDGLPAYGAGFFSSDALLKEHRDRVAAERPKVLRDVLAERVLAVGVVIIGTLLNGYGSVIARLFHLRGA